MHDRLRLEVQTQDYNRRKKKILAESSFKLAENWKDPLSKDEVINVFRKISLSYQRLIWGTNGNMSINEEFLREVGALELIRSAGAFVALRHKNFGFMLGEIGKSVEEGTVVSCEEIDEDLCLEGFDISEPESVLFDQFLLAIGEVRYKADLQGMVDAPFFELVGNGYAGEYRLGQDSFCSFLLDYDFKGEFTR